MSTSPLSRALPAPTLADVVRHIRNDETLPGRRRQDLVSACNVAATALGHDLATIPADPNLLRRRLAAVSPNAVGLNTRHWNNTRSLVGCAVGRVVPVTAGRRRNPLTPEWAKLQTALETPFRRARLSSLMRFASEQGLLPEALDQAAFGAYPIELSASLRKNPEQTYRMACGTWNNAVNTIPGWPPFQAAVIDRRQTWTLPWSRFPDSLCQDVTAWLRRLGGEDLLAELPFRPLRCTTVKMRMHQFRQAASALVCRGWDPADLRSLADLTTLDAFKEILRYLIDRRGGTPRGQVGPIAMLLQSTARHKLQASKERLDAMGAIIRRIRKQRQIGMTEQNRTRLHALDDPAAAEGLVCLPERLMAEARRTRSLHKAALLVQTALAIELLLMAPLRIANLAALDLERHISRPGRRDQVWITIPAHEVKNNVNLDYPLPPPTIALLDVFVRNYRDRLVTRESTALFPGRSGKGRDAGGFGKQISGMVKRYTDLTVNPHLFRHVGAKLFLEAEPGAYEVVRLALGHKSIETTTSFYTGTEAAAAIRHFHQTILSRREPGAPQ